MKTAREVAHELVGFRCSRDGKYHTAACDDGTAAIEERDRELVEECAKVADRRTPAAPPEAPGNPWDVCDCGKGQEHSKAVCSMVAATPGTAPTPPSELVTIRGCCEQATQLMSDGREAWSYCPVHGKTPAVIDAGTPRGDE